MYSSMWEFINVCKSTCLLFTFGNLVLFIHGWNNDQNINVVLSLFSTSTLISSFNPTKGDTDHSLCVTAQPQTPSLHSLDVFSLSAALLHHTTSFVTCPRVNLLLLVMGFLQHCLCPIQKIVSPTEPSVILCLTDSGTGLTSPAINFLLYRLCVNCATLFSPWLAVPVSSSFLEPSLFSIVHQSLVVSQVLLLRLE